MTTYVLPEKQAQAKSFTVKSHGIKACRQSVHVTA